MSLNEILAGKQPVVPVTNLGRIKDVALVSSDVATIELLKVADSVIKNYFGGNFGKRNSEGKQLPIALAEDEINIRDLMVTGLALRLNTLEIIKAIKVDHPEWNPVDGRGKSKVQIAKDLYGDLIDELYVAMATRIGDIYRFTDKIYRLKCYNDLAESIHSYFGPRCAIGLFDKQTIAVGNLLVKILDRTNSEMSDNFGMHSRPKDDESINPVEARKLLKEKYGDQLPDGVDLGIETNEQ